jgi:hypothetical protein
MAQQLLDIPDVLYPFQQMCCLTWPKASVAEPLRDQLLELCRQRLDAFRMQRGEEVGCLLTQPAASGTGAATAPRSAARSKSGHGADGLALHQPEWNAVVELVYSMERR